MAALLEILFVNYDRDTCLAILRDSACRDSEKLILNERLVQAGMQPKFLNSSTGDNLFLAVLGLRLKFPLEDARAKVALNIAMREGRA